MLDRNSRAHRWPALAVTALIVVALSGCGIAAQSPTVGTPTGTSPAVATGTPGTPTTSEEPAGSQQPGQTATPQPTAVEPPPTPTRPGRLRQLADLHRYQRGHRRLSNARRVYPADGHPGYVPGGHHRQHRVLRQDPARSGRRPFHRLRRHHAERLDGREDDPPGLPPAARQERCCPTSRPMPRTSS